MHSRRALARRCRRWAALVLILFAAVACRSQKKAPDVRATVTCSPATSEAVIDCEVEGATSANVCWVVVAHCKNGSEASSARLCQTVQRGATVRRSLNLGELSQGASCSRAERAEVRDVELAPL